MLTKEGQSRYIMTGLNASDYNRKQMRMLVALMDKGAIDRYRCPYNTRHTFITLMLAEGYTVSQVAKLVGNSPAVTLQHYAGNINIIVQELPEL
jgi:integrase